MSPSIDVKQAGRILDCLEDQDISSSCLERSLELPTGTVQRWKDGVITAEEMSLLKILYVYPWIVHVADDNFNENTSRAKVLEEATNILCRMTGT